MGERLLKDVCDVTYGFAFNSKRFSLDESVGLPVIRIRDLKDGFSHTYTDESCDDKYLINNGDFLIGMDGEFNIVKWNGGTALLNQRVCKICSTSDELVPDFLQYVLAGELKRIESQTSYVTVKHLSAKVLNQIEFRVPSISQQRTIVDVLDSVRTQISLIEQMLAKADELVQSRFVEMFLDGSLPKVSIGKLASDIRYGTSKKASSQGDYIYIRMNNITDDGYLDLFDVKYISLEGQELEKCMVVKGDVLFNRTNSREKVGKTAVFLEDRPMVIAGYIIRIRLGAEMRGEYLSAFMNLHSVKAMLRGMAKGAVHQANINAKELAEIEVPVPPLALQNEFAAFVTQVESMKSSLTAQRDRLTTLYDSLAQRYFAE